ncbi:M20/M25/M40 family metallo-hydrolase [Pseudoalteromonas denitrificans]|uniref:Carboxypeptidase Q n=1 Tax=Pseudoalteromonas denitrificans DSM 6059 TaxID=1123010 RepID=A0A1I1MJU5_9GAMM|nr:M20/M25/M40 family metallo-hydrolase [Pseudoalteromonas denitrificans]SFC82913.1 Zn-dependent amino-or carboxypeptidase, M28 family [Pseudoalteromonas denitrificans DSM 6059]
MKKLLLTLAITSLSFINQVSAQEFSEQQIKQTAEIRNNALNSSLAYDILTSLTTEIGPRLPGSENDPLAVKWAQDKFNELGFDKVWLEPATFPAWRRYSESGMILAPSKQPLHLTALGGSISTPKQGISADIIYFETLDELIASPKNSAEGKIVFINYKMNRHIDGNGYGPAVKARSTGAVEAAKKGALAFMMRSVSTAHHRFAHTGGSHYQDGIKKIPTVAIANPDADQISRLVSLKKPVKVNINVQAENLGEGKTFNVIGQFNGTQNPDQYVLIGGHLDSWDLGTGALDDGAGVALTMAAAKYIADVKRPKRSIRVVLFAAEELGLWGAKAYAKKHKNDKHNIVAAAESDFGAGFIYGFQSSVDAKSLPVVRAIAKQLSPLNIKHIRANKSSNGPDLIPLRKLGGLAGFSLHTDGNDYFDYHHTADDTLDKVDPVKLQQNSAAYAVFAFMAADAKTTIKGK